MASTTIKSRQIEDGAITDAKVAAGAAIASSKLADGANFVKRDGTVAMTGNLDLGSQRITNVNTPSGSNDACNKSYVDTLIAGLNSLFDSKGSCKAASTGNVTISNPGTAIFDGVTLSNGDRILLKNQSTGAENGIYVFNGSGSAMTRADDMNAWAEIPGALVAIEEGSTNADTLWLCTANAGGTIGSTSVTWQQVNSSGLTNSNFVDKETPSGSVNGSNTTFTLANTPTSGSEHVHLNGILLEPGAGNDYTISGATITMLSAPLSGEKIRVSYRK
ncbi:MAG: hypothetical protein IT174_10760 [Acidobacteria bacterium]|nr:hypothetical protein [Acidobacteriota bacterium]